MASTYSPRKVVLKRMTQGLILYDFRYIYQSSSDAQ